MEGFTKCENKFDEDGKNMLLLLKFYILPVLFLLCYLSRKSICPVGRLDNASGIKI